MPARKSQFQIWYEQVKRELLVTEPQNILARSECCQNIINECISHMNTTLGLPALKSSEQYVCQVEPKKHLKFLLEWPGLRVDNSPKAPKTKKEYEKKSKNWLNGRRAPNYGKTLFPFFIHDAEKYVLKISKIVIQNDEEKGKLYYDIVIYKVLAQLCGCSVSLHEQAKKAPFFCKNSVERKGRLKEILQGYASDHEYIQGFPSCFEEAIGYFDRKSNMFFQEYRAKYLGYTESQFDDENDSFMDPEEMGSSTSSLHGNRSRRRHVIKTSPKSQMTYKRERGSSRQRVGGADAEYWKKQFLNLKREFAVEQEKRMKAEKERDNLKNLIDTTNTNNNLSPMSSNPHLHGNALSLCNDSSFGSSTTASTATLSICNDNNCNNMGMVNGNGVSVPCLKPTTSYQSHQSHQSNCSGHSHHSHHSHSCPQQQQQQQQPMIATNAMNNMGFPHNNTFQINHSQHHFNNGNNPHSSHHHMNGNNTQHLSSSYGPAMPPIVNNCTNNNYLNNNNGFNQLSLSNNSFIIPHNVNNQNQGTTSSQSIATSMIPTSSVVQNNNMNHNNNNNMNLNTNNNNSVTGNQPSLLFQNSANNDNFGMPATDTISTIIDTMPIMNRQQQISDDNFPAFGGDNNLNGLSSPLPMNAMYSFN